jgi:lysophospholipase L1-like esterase
MNRLFKIILSLVFVVNFFVTYAQKPPYWNEIQAFKKQDSVSLPPQNAILFVGSSSFNYWKDVDAYFPGYVIINRGFGGSSLPDVIRYADEIIFPYQPKQIVIYCGENDLAASDTASAQLVFNRFKSLYSLVRNRLPNVNIAYVSIKPSPSRLHLIAKMREANAMIKGYLENQKNAAYINVFDRMLNEDGTPMKDLFVQDNLHMNARGYTIWSKIISPYLIK